MKLPEIVANLHTKMMADKRILSGIILGIVTIVSVGGYFGYQELVGRWTVPSVSGANFSLEYRKIPFDVKSIDITFSTPLDATSLTANSVTISPFVEGAASIKDKNTISYTLTKKLVVGESYTLTIASGIRSSYGKELGSEQIFSFEAIA